jgi:taurine dioxygenase
MASMLVAREVPAGRRRHRVRNMYLAYETLSSGMKRLLDASWPSTARPPPNVSRTREDA